MNERARRRGTCCGVRVRDRRLRRNGSRGGPAARFDRRVDRACRLRTVVGGSARAGRGRSPRYRFVRNPWPRQYADAGRCGRRPSRFVWPRARQRSPPRRTSSPMRSPGVGHGHDALYRRAYLDVITVITNLDVGDRRGDLHAEHLAAEFAAAGLAVAARGWASPGDSSGRRHRALIVEAPVERRARRQLPGRTDGCVSRLRPGCPGCSAAWLARLLWEQEAGSSNLPIPTTSTWCDTLV